MILAGRSGIVVAMPRSRPAPPPSPDAAGFAIEIDPELIEAALESVDRRMRHVEPEADEVDVEVETTAPELVIPPELADLVEPSPAETALRAELGVRDARIEALEREGRAFHSLRLELEDTRATLEAQLREARAAHSQLYSEFERFRVRARKDREDAERTGEERVLQGLLDTMDNLQRALGHAGAPDGPVARGLSMVVDQLQSRLRRLGVERIAATPGTPFDPEVHEAMQRVTTADVPPGSVAVEVSPGYRHRGRLVRAARVSVAVAPPAPPPAPAPASGEPAGSADAPRVSGEDDPADAAAVVDSQ